MNAFMVRARLLRALAICPVAAMVLCLPAQGQPTSPRFRVTSLGELDFNPSSSVDTRDGRTLFGINDHGEIAFSRRINDEFHALVCLPQEAAYGLDPGVTYLNDLFTMESPNVARDINVDGLVAGQIEGYEVGAGMAVVWDLAATPEKTMTQLGFLDDSNWSGAFAINDADPPVIVGESDAVGWCPNPYDQDCGYPADDEDVVRSFYLTLQGGPPFELTELGRLPMELDCDLSSSVRDVADLGSGLWRAVGISHTEIVDPESTCAVSVGDCQDGRPDDAVAWHWDGYEINIVTLPSRDPDRRSRALGVNESGQCAGWGFRSGPPSVTCKPDGLFWASDSAEDRVNLGDYMPDGQDGDESMAAAVNNLAEPQVVGWNVDRNNALLWEKSGDSWTGIDLNDEIDPNSGVDGLREALDINDDGWIVCWGDGDLSDEGFEPYGFLLTPLPDCHEDLNGDNVVDIDDVFEVLSHWGDAPLGVIWKWDVNSDFTVDIDDTFAVIAAWGPCAGDGGGGGQGLAAILADWLADGGADALDKDLVTWDEINNCLTNESEDSVEDCLYGLLKQ